MTFTEIIKAIGGILFIAFIVYGVWQFCCSVVDFMIEKFGEDDE